MSKSTINPTMLISTTKRCRFYHHRLRITQILHTTTTHCKHTNNKTSMLGMLTCAALHT
jgi:hypothetical protein